MAQPGATTTSAKLKASPDPASPVAPASMRRRLAALVYEGTLLSAMLLVAGFLFAPAASLPQGIPPVGSALAVPPLPARILLFCALFAVGALYYTWSWTDGRRTLPMKTWHMRITMRDGRMVAPKAALLRYLAAWIGPALALIAYDWLRPAGHGGYALWVLGLGYAWAGIDRDRQFLHDRIAGTRIVTDPPRR